MNQSNASLDTVIIATTRMKELAEFYQKGFELGLPQEYGDDHVGFQLSAVYLGFDSVDKVWVSGGRISLCNKSEKH